MIAATPNKLTSLTFWLFSGSFWIPGPKWDGLIGATAELIIVICKKFNRKEETLLKSLIKIVNMGFDQIIQKNPQSFKQATQ